MTRRQVAAYWTVILALAVAMFLYLYVDDTTSTELPDPNPVYVVRPGDTLWSIAREHYPDADPRAAVYAIRQLNDVRPEAIRPGDILMLPREVR